MGSSPMFLVTSSNSFHKPPVERPSRGRAATTTIRTREDPQHRRSRHQQRKSEPIPSTKLKSKDVRDTTADDATIWATGSPVPLSKQNSFLKRLLLCEKVLNANASERQPQSQLKPEAAMVTEPPTPTHLKPLFLVERYGLSTTPTPAPPSTSSANKSVGSRGTGSDIGTDRGARFNGQPSLMMVKKMTGSKIGQPPTRVTTSRISNSSTRPVRGTVVVPPRKNEPVPARKSNLPRNVSKRAVVPPRKDLPSESEVVPQAQPTKMREEGGTKIVPDASSAQVNENVVESNILQREGGESTDDPVSSQSHDQALEECVEAVEDNHNDCTGQCTDVTTAERDPGPAEQEATKPTMETEERNEASDNKENEDENAVAEKSLATPPQTVKHGISARISLLAQSHQPLVQQEIRDRNLTSALRLRKLHLPELPDGSRASRNEIIQREIEALRTMKRVEMGGVALIKGRAFGGGSAPNVAGFELTK